MLGSHPDCQIPYIVLAMPLPALPVLSGILWTGGTINLQLKLCCHLTLIEKSVSMQVRIADGAGSCRQCEERVEIHVHGIYNSSR